MTATFDSLGLAEPLMRAVIVRNYPAPTPVQVAAIPAVLGGRDVWATAQTGSGKTAAFALPILQTLAAGRRERGRFVRALVLAPTRELAAQIGDSFRIYGRWLPEPIKILIVYGGVSINPQMMALGGGADIIIATPGRLLDLVDHNAVSLSAVQTLVLDEADRLFDLGFADELNRVLELLPAKRQNLLFSATFPPAVLALAAGMLRDPVRIEVATEPATKPDITQRAIEVDPPRRTQLLRHLIEENKWTRVLVFVATKYATEHVAEKLRKAGIAATAFHGELSQGARTQALADFKASAVRVLLTTDLGARGLDIAQLPVVVNFDLPRSATDYTHRIGRTGRAGESGLAVNFISAETHRHFGLIEERNGFELVREQIPGFEPEELEVPPPPTGGIKGKRPNKKDKARAAAAKAAGLPPPEFKPAVAKEKQFSWPRLR
ncbi:ATP-dependent RNA helicase RhlE [Lacunisphaera limnophila]|uniref:ATP-dependent RNA helicase RhlE n=1 Tax=Lacunisphaera limnophila TaxID=1838286 RepID=A0A1D8AYV3_9BACT|nr:DEAD/DEAH box helicase [Lacunisphaera limnophila]AOS46078.1 ATP-dependent RNA helicase RhlE [Lacunisphaera limnophila]